MVRLPIAFMLLAALPAAAAAQDGSGGNWGLARAPGSCMLHASSPQGTVLSVWGFAGQSKIGFLIQNKQWDTLREGQSYDLRVDFVGVRAWPVQATGRTELDGDGPGYFFTIEPGEQASGDAFLDAFASAKGMEISRNGAEMDNLPLAGSREAMSALARCMAALWANEAGPAELVKQARPVPVLPTT